MFCLKCGAKLEDGAKFCMRCGTAVRKIEAPSSGTSNPADKFYETEVLYSPDQRGGETVSKEYTPSSETLDRTAVYYESYTSDERDDTRRKKKHKSLWIVLVMIGIVMLVSVIAYVAVILILKNNQKDTGNQTDYTQDQDSSELADEETSSSDEETEPSMSEEETDTAEYAYTIAEEISTTQEDTKETTTQEDTSSSIYMVVTDQKGKTVSSAEVVMEVYSNSSNTYYTYKGKTGSDGVFRVDACISGVYTYSIKRDGYEDYSGGPVNVAEGSENQLTAKLKSTEVETTTEAPKLTLDELVGMDATYLYELDFDMDGTKETLGIYQYEDEWGQLFNCQIWYEDGTGKTTRMFKWENDSGNSFCVVSEPLVYYDSKGRPYVIVNSSRRVAATYVDCMIFGLDAAGNFGCIYDEYSYVRKIADGYIDMTLQSMTVIDGANIYSEEDKTAYIEQGEVKFVETSAADDQYILPNSDTKYLTEADLKGLTDEELRLARNEIYARHGRMFATQDLSDYFNAQSWYEPKYSPSEFDAMASTVLNKYEMANLDLILAEEASRQ